MFVEFGRFLKVNPNPKKCVLGNTGISSLHSAPSLSFRHHYSKSFLSHQCSASIQIFNSFPAPSFSPIFLDPPYSRHYQTAECRTLPIFRPVQSQTIAAFNKRRTPSKCLNFYGPTRVIASIIKVIIIR